MTSKFIYAVSGDTNRTVGVVLYDDGVAVDLSAADAIECHMRDRATGTVTTITGLTGNASGEVATTIGGPLTAGTKTLEWEVTVGSVVTTYPGAVSLLPILVVRSEAA
jgi:formylmethanofuran dehydrogenase subunit C